MKKFLKRFKLDNKGDTLAIVLIGILIIGILASVMLRATGVNFRMKISDLKNKQNFYYVEKAIDDIYAGIGKEVTKAAQESYDEVVGTLVEKDASGTYKYKAGTTAGDDFKNKYFSKLTVNTKYPATSAAGYSQVLRLTYINNVLGVLEGYVDSSYYSAFNVDIEIGVTSASDYGKAVLDDDTTKVVHDTANGTITIKNVVVKAKSTVSNYEASVTTDFVIKTPDISFDFSDSSSKDLTEFYKYAIVANGDVTPKTNPDKNLEKGAVYVKSGTAHVYGNIYAGAYKAYLDYPGMSAADKNRYYIDKEGIYIAPNASLNINAADVVTRGAVELDNGASISFEGEDPVKNSYASSPKSLRLWANDILLSGDSSNANINGDCFIKDDLEVNGNQGTINVAGSYYGIGLDAKTLDRSTHDYEENNSNVSTKFDYSKDGDVSEHEKRSAVIVNGDGANVQLATDASSTKNFVLGGRAYIDLSGGSNADSKNADYMTGESIAIKGNQQIYLISNIDNADLYDSGSPTLKGNPMQVNDIINSWTGWSRGDNFTTDEFYTNLSLKRSSVVAKRIGESVYFYNRQENPFLQTGYVVDSITNTTTGSYDRLVEAINNMSVENLCLGNNTKSYTVGTAMQVKGGALTTGRGDELNYQESGIDRDEFVDIICDSDDRYDMMMYNIMSNISDSDDRDKNIGKGNIANTSTDSDGDGYPDSSPYDYFIQHGTWLDGYSPVSGRAPHEILPKNGTSVDSEGYKQTDEKTYPSGTSFKVRPVSQKDLIKMGLPDTAALELIVYDNLGKDDLVTANNLSSGTTLYGVLVCSGNVTVNCDFVGMIICGGNITIEGNYKFTAKPEIMELLRDRSDYLQKLIDTAAAPTIKFDQSKQLLDVPDDTFAFDKFVTFENWRKNAE